MAIELLPEQVSKDPLFAEFIRDIDQLVLTEARPVELTTLVKQRMQTFLKTWKIQDERYCAMQPDQPYGSFLLYLAPESRFVVVIDTFDENQTTRAHNHRTWAVVGLMEGSERDIRFATPDGLHGAPQKISETQTQAGDIATVLENEFHALATSPSYRSRSLHVYGADIGRITRLCWDEEERCYRQFAQGYSNDPMNLPPYFETVEGG